MHTTRPEIVMIGAGNVAHHLSKVLHRGDYSIRQVWSRDHRNARNLSKRIGAESTDDLSSLHVAEALVFICVPDDHIIDTLERMAPQIEKTSTILHASGNMSSSILRSFASRYGVFYPLQSLNKRSRISAKKIPILYNASEEETLSTLKKMSQLFSPLSRSATDDLRMQLHLPAVFMNNFSTALASIAYDLCKKQKLPFEILMPLFQETALRIKSENDPMKLITGPAARGDESTINKHLERLSADQLETEIYALFTDYIKYKKDAHRHKF